MLRGLKLLFVTILFFVVLKFPFVPVKTKSKIILKIIKAGGVAFVKLGQSLAVRPDIIGEVYADELKNLQDNMDGFSFSKVKSILPSDVFKNIEETPVACASIAQVHKGELLDGTKVAVKVLRPNIKKIFMADIKLFYKSAYLYELISPKARRLKIFDVIGEMHNWVNSELSLQTELNNINEMAENFANVDEYQGDYFMVPKTYPEYSNDNVLVLEWIDGIRIDDVEGYKKNGLSGKDILKKSANSFFLQVFRDGFFHADMHPGNMLIDSKGNLRPLDFGIMGRLSKKSRIYVADILYYLMNKKYDELAEVHFKAGYVPSTYGLKQFANELEKLDNSVRGRGNLSNISMGEVLTKLFEITEKYQMKTRPELLLLKKTIVVAEGVGRIVAPNENMWGLISETISDWYKVNRGISARVEETLMEIVVDKGDENETQSSDIMTKNQIKKSIAFDLSIIIVIVSLGYITFL